MKLPVGNVQSGKSAERMFSGSFLCVDDFFANLLEIVSEVKRTMKISNGTIEVEASSHGAELLSIRRNGKEYVWQGDPKYWGRHAPVLFPIVGKVWNDEYRVSGQTFHLTQHGFARDMDFGSIPQDTGQKMAFVLKSDGHTRSLYPYDFQLKVEYELDADTLTKRDIVKNTGDIPMYYMIGNHPAFLYRDFDPADKIHGYVCFYNGRQLLKDFMLSPLTEHGALKHGKTIFTVPSGVLELKADTFDDDALVFENSQIDMAVLLDKGQNPYLAVSFPIAQTLGIWSSKGKNAPFVCIEPWNGLTDPEGFEGDITERAWIQRLEPGAEEVFEYTVTVLD